ncbi:MAG: ATP-binding protein [Chloroflexota bacterium]
MPSAADRRLPTGTVTFLFTDIEGSTQLVSAFGAGYGPIVEAHAAIIRAALVTHSGTEVGTEGDAFFAAFPSAVDAVSAAAEIQRRLSAEPWPEGATVRVRIGLHTGEALLGGDDYIGIDVHRAARIAAAGHGGQVLVSDATRALVAASLPDDLSFRDLAEHKLKDLPAPERIWQLSISGLSEDFPPIRSVDWRRGNILPSPTPLIGRRDELTAITDLVMQRPLVTLIGPGGTGKTRLGRAVAEQLATDFTDGAYFVSLQDARDQAAVAAAIADAIAVRERPDRDLEQGVKEHLRNRHSLLVLDNFEQVVDAAPFIAELLAASPGLRVVVTSRAVLHLSGEQTFEVPPLRVPDGRDLPPVAEVGRYEAIALFVERGRAVKPGFELTADNAAAVVEICRRLDGLPLAIELAAARIRLLSPIAILGLLADRLLLLGATARDVPARQRTLSAAIDWSYDLLEPAEARLFERLAVFAGGWTIEAAKIVCNPGAELGMDTLDGLTSLADNSLIQPIATDHGEPRFGMLQIIREFAAEKLASARDAAEVRQRHTLHVLELAEAAGPELRSSVLRMWQHTLRSEQENIRTVLRRTTDGGDVIVGLRIAGAIWDYWHYWAELREGARWLEALLTMPAAAEPTLVRAQALRALAGLRYWQGDGHRALVLYEEALGIVRTLGDDGLIAATLHDSAWGAIAIGDLAAAIRRGEESRDLYVRIGDETRATIVSSWLSVAPIVTGHGGDIAAAFDGIQQAIDANQRLGRTHEVADWLETLPMFHRAVGDFANARATARESLRLWYELGTLGRLPLGLKMLAAAELGMGDPERAVRLGAAAERFNDEIGGEVPDIIAQLGTPVEEARPMLDRTDHARAVTEGRSMSLDRLIAYALE